MATLTLKVPSIVCEGCADVITKNIVNYDAQAKVDVNVTSKTVSVETETSESSIKELITSIGHTVE
ncbi:heavy-metal-associated domain-containing protein [Limnofasciculus baicalensis]|uniref:Heavy-metal-associated domain-containing protein n=1 Tax=Limnofasciculus baicalensis BBK-W-15 TaxID=2699891 RepID=A0AAE3GX65_9CYAN|nr:heavy-metal-associated domain-containing protein [Limnofasciculus baicalensis]MCP2732124.1 heavy-metal-associated domain-containing protein [Limnofasciculus baicalensis BBK-W-15]